MKVITIVKKISEAKTIEYPELDLYEYTHTVTEKFVHVCDSAQTITVTFILAKK